MSVCGCHSPTRSSPTRYLKEEGEEGDEEEEEEEEEYLEDEELEEELERRKQAEKESRYWERMFNGES